MAAIPWRHHVVGESGEWSYTYDPWKVGTLGDVLPLARPALQDVEAFEGFDNREYFGSFAKSLLTAFQAIESKQTRSGDMPQVVTTAQWANHIARPIVFKHRA